MNTESNYTGNCPKQNDSILQTYPINVRFIVVSLSPTQHIYFDSFQLCQMRSYPNTVRL
jgi:hypothetical protein